VTGVTSDMAALRRAMVLAIRQASAHAHGINRRGHRGHPSPGGSGHPAGNSWPAAGEI